MYKVGLQYAPPIFYLSLRLVFGGLLLILFLLPRRHELRLKTSWRFYVGSAVLNVILTMGLQTIGMVYLPGGLISIFVYIQPIFVSILAWLLLGDSMSRLKIISLFLGFTGIVLVSIDSLFLNFSKMAIFIALLSALFWAIGVIYVKKASAVVNSFWMVAMQSFIGGVALLIFSIFTEDWSSVQLEPWFFIAVGWGSTFGIPIAFIIYYYLNDHIDISKVSAYTFLVPVLAVILGILFLAEPFTFNILAGLLLVSLSIYLINNEKQLTARIRRKKEVAQ